jgi:hypothetical protein
MPGLRLAHAALLAPRVMVANDIAPKALPGREGDTSKAMHQSRSHRVPPLVQFLGALLLISERVRSK